MRAGPTRKDRCRRMSSLSDDKHSQRVPKAKHLI